MRGEMDGSYTGTGTYIILVNLKERVPNMIPMLSQKVMVKYKGVQRSAKKMLSIPQRNNPLQKRTLHDFVEQFKDKNPGLDMDWFELLNSETNETHEEN
jgi:hypothetical protein